MTPNFGTQARRIAVGVVLAALVGAGFMVASAGDDKQVLVARMADPGPIVVGNEVRMAGVVVGSISGIELVGGQAEMTMEVERSVLPLHRDATVRTRPVSLLGERFLDLDRGSDDEPVIPERSTMKVAAGKSTVDLDQVVTSLGGPTSEALAALLTTLGEGTGNNGKEIDQAIKALAPAMTDVGELGKVLDEQNALLTELLDQATPVGQAVATNHGRDLDALVSSTRSALAVVASERRAFDTALRDLPATLQQARTTLAELSRVSKAATPTLRAARPITNDLTQITGELDQFAAAAQPALSSLPPVLSKARALIDQAAPLVRDLRPGAKGLKSTAADAKPILMRVSTEFTTLMDFVKMWALSTNGKDAISHYFRGFVVNTPKALLQIPGPGIGPGSAPGKPAGPIGPAVPAKPDLLSGVPDLLDVLGGNATGLTPKQEGSLLNQILGGP